MKLKILEKVTTEYIYQYYFPEEIKTSKYYINPLREDDTNPGCFFTYLGNELFFVDFAYNPTHIDCFKFIQNFYNLSFYETLVKISKDLNLNLHKPSVLFEKNTEFKKDIKNVEIKIDKVYKSPSIIKVITRNFNKTDLDYWSQFGITESTLKFFNVKAVERAWINNNLYYYNKSYDPAYRYREKDSFKIYRPFAYKKLKWRSNMSGGILECWDQLPDSGDILIITKSKKDVMTLYEAGYNAIAVKAESVIVSENSAELLNSRFSNIYTWFDNDDTGNKFSEIQNEKYGWKTLVFPKEYPKDPSDFVKKYDLNKLKEFIKKNLIT